MFKKIRIKNFRTHIDTTIDLSDLTLIIGANNSGKSNLLAGINHFSKFVSQAYPGNDKRKKINNYDFFPHRHSLSKEDEPMEFYCSWEREQYLFEYQLILFSQENNNRKEVFCKEELKIAFDKNESKFFRHGYDINSSELLLRTNISKDNNFKENKEIIELFFKSLSFAFYYNLQPSFLKGVALPFEYDFFKQKSVVTEHINFCQRYKTDGKGVSFAIGLGEQGHNFQELIKYVKQHEDETYGRFVGYLKRFVKSFNAIVIDVNRDKVQWQFDMGNNNFPCYDAEKVSEGLLKAGAVALLCAMRTPPAIIMLEEVENGINQKNLSEFLSWLKSASHNNRTQFILTSHSPSVIREFNEDLDNVYKVDLKEKSGYKSSITKLSDALVSLISLGTIDEDTIIGYKEIDGKQIAQIRAYELTELFYNGVLGNL